MGAGEGLCALISTQSQVYGPINHIEEEEGEREEGPGVQVDSLSGRGDDGFGRRRPLVVLGLGLPSDGFNRLPVAVKVRQLKVPWERAHNAEVVGPQVRLGGAHLLTAGLRHLVARAGIKETRIPIFLNCGFFFLQEI